MNKKTLTFIGILTLALICLTIAIVTSLVTYGGALLLVWALSKPWGLTAFMMASFVFLFTGAVTKVANRIEEDDEK